MKDLYKLFQNLGVACEKTFSHVTSSEFSITAIDYPNNLQEILKKAKGLKSITEQVAVKVPRYDHIIISYRLKSSNGKPYIAINILCPHYALEIDTDYRPDYSKERMTLLCFDDGVRVQMAYKSVTYPANISHLSLLNDSIKEVIMLFYGNKSCKDFLTDNFYPPIEIAKLNEYHNKKAYCEKLFDLHLPKSVNKIPFERLYAFCCACKYIPKDQFAYFYNNGMNTDFCFYHKPSIRNRKAIATDFLKNYFAQFVNEDLAKDYVEMSLNFGKPADVTARKHKLQRLHDELIDEVIKKSNKGKKLTIPESPLKYLDLPFDLITTKSRLETEGKLNHNCVGTYLDKINKGKCVIFSGNVNGEHLTIEVTCTVRGKKNRVYKFSVSQCYKSYNRSPNVKSYNYVVEYVKNAMDNAVNKFIRKNKENVNDVKCVLIGEKR